jgi:predicted RNase H-like HicB family nuclease
LTLEQKSTSSAGESPGSSAAAWEGRLDSCSAEREPSSICPSNEARDPSYSLWERWTGHSKGNIEQYLEASTLEIERMRYAVVIEKSGTGYGAFVPDLPGCVAMGETIEETEELIKEAIQFHLEGMKEDGVKTPSPTSVAEYVEV